MYLSHWISTLFVYNSPRELVFRIWDVLFLEPWDHVVKIAISLVTSVQGAVFALLWQVFALLWFRVELSSAML